MTAEIKYMTIIFASGKMLSFYVFSIYSKTRKAFISSTV